MSAADNLFNTTQNFLTPEFVHRFSAALGQPDEKIADGLRTVIPTFLFGLIDKGSTDEGAEQIVHMVEEENFNSDAPQNLNDESYLSKGEHVIEDIFGKDYHSVASSLTPASGLNSDSLEKMMEMIAPVVMGVLNNKIKDERMSPRNLSGFLQQQRKVMKGFTPSPLETGKPNRYGKRKAPFGLIAFIILIGLFTLFWIFSRQSLSVATLTRNISSVHTASTTVENPATDLIQLKEFLRTGNDNDLPKRFGFDRLTFILGTTDLAEGGNPELDFIAEALMNNPKVNVRIDAYVENTGDPEENLLLSENRAMLIREELIGRGVEPSRIRAEGRGVIIGRGQAELVITRK